MQAIDTKTQCEMLEMAYRWARDKHLQKVFFQSELNFLDQVDFAKRNGEPSLESFSTTKI